MAREFARIHLSIADDEDLEELSVAAQWLYFRVLLPEPTLNQCGVADWRPKRLVGKAKNATLEVILAAAAEIEERRYALFDLETEEVLVRSHIRRDELLRNPKMAAAVIKSYRAVASRTLRSATVTEIQRVRQEHPEYSSWTSSVSGEDLSRILDRTGLDLANYTNQIGNAGSVANTNRITNDITNRNTNHIGDDKTNGITETSRDPITNPIRSTFPATATAPLSLQLKESGYVSTEGNEGDEDEAPSPNCPEHPEGTTRPCSACGAARRARQDWDAAQRRAASLAVSTEARQRAEARAQAIVECDLCDDDGYAEGWPCDHDPDRAETNRAGIAKARAALAKGGTDA